ncbi:hypothetical protein DFJ74DRAFT_766953 [Hyaloraphidium curvatum]|nr:hypothetical protein DFJ74DRAFT_766953 [Hyaloraphidium curvatum]
MPRLDWFLGGLRPAHILLLGAAAWYLRDWRPHNMVELRLPDGLPPFLASALLPPAAPAPLPPPIPAAAPRRFTFADFERLMGVQQLHATATDPRVAHLLDAHDIRKDKAYTENPEAAEQNAFMYGTWIDRGTSGDERFYVEWTGPQRGYGLFAAVGIPIGTPVGVFGGVVTNASYGSRYSWAYNSDGELPGEDGRPLSLVLDGWLYGNYLRYPNHENEPNTEVVFVPYKNRWHVVYVSSRAISPGEEVTISYGDAYWEGSMKDELVLADGAKPAAPAPAPAPPAPAPAHKPASIAKPAESEGEEAEDDEDVEYVTVVKTVYTSTVYKD